MHRSVTILAVCLLILLAFPRVLTEEIKKEKDETKNNNHIEKNENITVFITEVKPMASGLIAENITEVTKNELPLRSNNETLEKVEVIDIISNNTVKEDGAIKSEGQAVVQETNVVEHHVSTPEPELNKDISQKNKETFSDKQGLINSLKNSIKEAEEDLAMKIKRLEEVKKRTNTARSLSEQAQNHLKSLIFALNSVQGSIIQSSKAAFETDWQLQLQSAMYNDAKRKFSRLSRELEMTKTDYEKTKIAAQSAMESAKIAQKNLIDAEKPATLILNEKDGLLAIGNSGTKP